MANVLGAMLDELMGKYRNAMPSERPKDPTWEDEDVCKWYLVGYCPHEMFTNTKADLGICQKIHCDKMKENYQKSAKFERVGYEDDYLAFLQKIQSDMERKIRRNRQRLELTQPNGQVADSNKTRLEDKMRTISEKISALIQQAEHLGAQGKVDEAQSVIGMCDGLKDEKEQLKQQLDASMEQDKLMEVCEICGCFLIVGDTDQRIGEHLTGKQHMGFAKIKATVEELQRRKEEKRRQRDEEIEVERKRRSAERRDKKPTRRSRSRSRDRGGQKSSKSRRSRSNSRHRHSHSKSARKSSRSRSRGRSDRHRHHHSGSQSKSSRDRSRERRRSKDRRREAEKTKKSETNGIEGKATDNQQIDETSAILESASGDVSLGMSSEATKSIEGTIDSGVTSESTGDPQSEESALAE